MSTFVAVHYDRASDSFQIQASHQIGSIDARFSILLTRSAAIHLTAAHKARTPAEVGTAEGLISLHGPVIEVALRRGVEQVTATIPSWDLIRALRLELERTDLHHRAGITA